LDIFHNDDDSGICTPNGSAFRVEYPRCGAQQRYACGAIWLFLSNFLLKNICIAPQVFVVSFYVFRAETLQMA
jgi:hypothetical protein